LEKTCANDDTFSAENRQDRVAVILESIRSEKKRDVSQTGLGRIVVEGQKPAAIRRGS